MQKRAIESEGARDVPSRHRRFQGSCTIPFLVWVQFFMLFFALLFSFVVGEKGDVGRMDRMDVASICQTCLSRLSFMSNGIDSLSRGLSSPFAVIQDKRGRRYEQSMRISGSGSGSGRIQSGSE